MIALAMILGICLAPFFSEKIKEKGATWVSPLLKISMVGLGFGLSCHDLMAVGMSHVLLIFLSMVITLLLGVVLSRLLKVTSDLGTLIAVGTAICGGSAIAAVSPILKSKHSDTVVALASVFLLNSLAILIFPLMGHLVGLSQSDFGLWAGIAIHDTSSVIGASSVFGEASLKMAIIIKSIRILFIIPVVIVLSIYMNKKVSLAAIPWFLGLFIGAVLLTIWVPSGACLYSWMYIFSKKLTMLPLFLLGLSFSIDHVKKGGLRPLVYATLLWLSVSLFVLGSITITAAI